MMIISKNKPKWYQIRWKLSNLFINIGRMIYPANPEIKAFWAQLMLDKAIYGQAIIKVNPEEFYRKLEN